MGVGRKYDYPPLLAPGRHIMTLDQVEAQFVKAFPGNRRRISLFQSFEEFVQAILLAGFPCEIWLDGSVLTEKEEPGDVDVTVILDKDVSDVLTPEQEEVVKAITNGQMGNNVDCFLFVRYPRHDARFGDEGLDPAHSWGEQYGLECSEQWLKGFVVLRLRETKRLIPVSQVTTIPSSSYLHVVRALR